ncbi:hypothetical protein PENSPDRAFT_208783 [Peniophora sp. CONT]|nr:hypothetical protein PENSPDRAFT_208783 [Peniophora sp. CONT]
MLLNPRSALIAPSLPLPALGPAQDMVVSSKPVVYLFPQSSWCACVRISIIELGLSDAIDIHTVDFLRAENLAPEFIAMSPNATVPVLSTSKGVHGDSTSTIEYLTALGASRTGRRIMRRTNLTDELHAEIVDSKFLTFSACDDAELAAKAASPLPRGLISRQEWTRKYANSPAGRVFISRYEAKIAHVERLISLYTGTASPAARADFFAKSRANRSAARALIYRRLPAALHLVPGPFIAGATPGEDDLHLIGWLAHVAFCSGARMPEDALSSMGRMFGEELPTQVGTLWCAWMRRESFRKVYGEGLY